MSVITVGNVLTGDVITRDPDRFISIESFKEWVRQNMKIEEGYDFLFTKKGVSRFGLDSIVDGQEFFVYDKKLVFGGGDGSEGEGSGQEGRREDKGGIGSLPKLDSDDGSLSIQDTFILHSNWVKICWDVVNHEVEDMEKSQESIDVITKGLNAVMEFMIRGSLIHKRNFDNKVDDAVVLEKDIEVCEKLEFYLDKIKGMDMLKVFSDGDDGESGEEEEERGGEDGEDDEDKDKGKDGYRSKEKRTIPLLSFIDLDSIRKASPKIPSASMEVQSQVKLILNQIQSIVRESENLQNATSQLGVKTSEELALNTRSRRIKDYLNELFALTDTINKDSETIMSKPESAKLRRWNLHKKELLPQIEFLCTEILKISNEWKERKVEFQSLSLKYLREFTDILQRKSYINPTLQKLTRLIESTRELVDIILSAIDLPLMYGILLVETIRRNKWMGYIKNDISQTAELLAGKRLEEVGRRKRWKDYYGGRILIDMINEEVGEFEINFNNHNRFSTVKEADVEDYIKTLHNLGLEEEREEVTNEYKSVLSSFQALEMNQRGGISNGINYSVNMNINDNNTTNESPKLFKSGNLTDAFIQERTDLNNQIKGHLSRIRILEDLLHKKQFNDEINRNSHSHSSSPAHSSHSHSSPRLIERIHQLEMQKQTDSKTITKLENDISQLKKSLEEKDKALTDALKVKSDLLANLTSQETEFSTERKSYTDEISELKNTIDSLEVENDQLIQDVNTSNERITELEEEAQVTERKLIMFDTRTRDLSQKLFTAYKRSCEVLESMGLQVTKEIDGTSVTFKINRVKGLRRKSESAILESQDFETQLLSNDANLKLLYWMDSPSSTIDEKYQEFINEIYIDYDIFRDTASKRVRDVEFTARKLQKEAKLLRERNEQITEEASSRLTLHSFKVGDLGLFLPTKDPTKVPNIYCAFNINAPHYFLNQKLSQELANRDYVIARITRIEEKVVNKAEDNEEDNPFDLSDGLRWYLIDAEPIRV